MSNSKPLFDYPVIAKLSNGWSLVAHPNCPAVFNGDTLAVLRMHGEFDPETQAAIREGEEAFKTFAYRALVKAGLWPGIKMQHLEKQTVHFCLASVELTGTKPAKPHGIKV